MKLKQWLLSFMVISSTAGFAGSLSPLNVSIWNNTASQAITPANIQVNVPDSLTKNTAVSLFSAPITYHAHGKITFTPIGDISSFTGGTFTISVNTIPPAAPRTDCVVSMQVFLDPTSGFSYQSSSVQNNNWATVGYYCSAALQGDGSIQIQIDDSQLRAKHAK